MVRNIYLSLKINLLELSRNRAALFWALTFPIFIYTVFYLIFGVFNDEDYPTFLLTGVLAMTIAANGLFGVGSIVKRSYQGGTIRLMKKMPLNIMPIPVADSICPNLKYLLFCSMRIMTAF